ncbi:MAG: hypothetical protein GC152_10800 [Alphaproteobacteria bacterium]|nr:hypothetical protein [Alphaproteobacteria bacterium]
MALYSWKDPGWVFLVAVLAATPFICASAMAPALLSFAPTVEPVGQVADARAFAAGASSIGDEAAPFQLMLLTLADRFADAPGRIQLIAKAIAAVLAAYPLAYFASVRLPTVLAVAMTAAIASFIVAPFSGPSDLALALFLVASTALALSPADEGWDRAIFEGLLVGGIMFALWLLNPVFTLAGFAVLSACPFLTGLAGFSRYATAFGTFVVFAIVAEIAVPGLNGARAEIASAMVAEGLVNTARMVGAWGLAGVAASSLVVIGATAVFGGREHARGWAAGAGFLAIAALASALSGAQPALAFAFAGAMAVFSIHSPFYDGIFRDHDRGSIAAAGAVGALVLFWFALTGVDGASQLKSQWQAGARQESGAAAALAIAYPTVNQQASWARAISGFRGGQSLVGNAPMDQSEMMFEAATRAKAISKAGAPIAFLTGDDTACVFAGGRRCRSDARAAAADASVVFVPRLDLSEATRKQKDHAEAFLYTEFKLAERTQFWELWVRRGALIPDAAIEFGQGL